MAAYKLMLVSLGCAKNTVDSETALGELTGEGYVLTTTPQEADVILINTCGFIKDARDEAYSVIAQMLEHKTARGLPKVVAMGCLAQRWGARMRRDFPELDGVLGLAAYGSLGDYLKSLFKGRKIVEGLSKNRTVAEGPRLLSTPASFAYLRIADGCENRCSYCAIPLIRGRVRSRKIEDVIEEARQLAQAGIPELVLVAQDTTVYGQDLYASPRLEELLAGILDATEKTRIRVLYAHPAHISDELFKMLGSEKRLCSYLDLPLQHINDRMLKTMNRHYDRAKVEHILEVKEKYAPELVLRTSLITGFPGETESEFQELLDFVSAGHFNYMGAFIYSPEEDTPSFDFTPKIPEKVAEKRLEALMLAQQPVTFRWLDGRVGRREELVVDALDSDGFAVCRGDAEAPETDGVVYVDLSGARAGEKIQPGGRITACLERRNDYDIEAIMV